MNSKPHEEATRSLTDAGAALWGAVCLLKKEREMGFEPTTFTLAT